MVSGFRPKPPTARLAMRLKTDAYTNSMTAWHVWELKYGMVLFGNLDSEQRPRTQNPKP